ncbi:MAG TPA: KH domain-containing protein [Thermoanaerobaculia bacterium]|nr:KH domain-containing protein [Thermoanaerobaculia bacterium]
MMDELIEFVAKSLVDNPDEVNVHRHQRDQQTVLELEVAEADLGKVIGRQGRTARALRTLLNAASQKTRRRYSLDILD